MHEYCEGNGMASHVLQEHKIQECGDAWCMLWRCRHRAVQHVYEEHERRGHEVALAQVLCECMALG